MTDKGRFKKENEEDDKKKGRQPRGEICVDENTGIKYAAYYLSPGDLLGLEK